VSTNRATCLSPTWASDIERERAHRMRFARMRLADAHDTHDTHDAEASASTSRNHNHHRSGITHDFSHA
jgi:hypothetical protein